MTLEKRIRIKFEKEKGKEMPKVSVIIPVYNVEKYLSQCLDSLVNQTLSDIEIICIDDGSSDKSFEILQEYANKDSRIKIFKQENQGAAVARNNGLDKATGDYLYFMDSDDYIKLDCLEKLYNKIILENSDICVCQNADMSEATQKLKLRRYGCDMKLVSKKSKFNVFEIPNYIFQFCSTPAFTKLYKSDFIKNNNIRFQEIKTCNDVFFNGYSLCVANSITTVPEALVVYRCGQKTNLSASRGNHISCVLDAFGLLKEELEKRNIFSLVEKSFYKRVIVCFNHEINQLEKSQRLTWAKKLFSFIPEEYRNLEWDLTFWETLFSVRNEYREDGKHKVITILGVKLKLKCK